MEQTKLAFISIKLLYNYQKHHNRLLHIFYRSHLRMQQSIVQKNYLQVKYEDRFSSFFFFLLFSNLSVEYGGFPAHETNNRGYDYSHSRNCKTKQENSEKQNQGKYQL